MESTSRSALYDEAARGTERVRQQEDAPGTYFLTLCPVAAPVSLPRSTSPALQRFRFFFTRERDGARERHWLNFGYFNTVEEARKWRVVLCRVYPAAVVRVIAVHGGARHW